jgi:hypothetical protein
LWAIKDTVEQKVTVDGGLKVFLTGKHVGLKWAGAPA